MWKWRKEFHKVGQNTMYFPDSQGPLFFSTFKQSLLHDLHEVRIPQMEEACFCHSQGLLIFTTNHSRDTKQCLSVRWVHLASAKQPYVFLKVIVMIN